MFVPAASVTVNGAAMTAWWQLNPATGELVAVMQNGGHQAFFEYVTDEEGNTIVSLRVFSKSFYVGRFATLAEAKRYVNGVKALIRFANVARTAGTGVLAYLGFALNGLELAILFSLAGTVDPPIPSALLNPVPPEPITPQNAAETQIAVAASASAVAEHGQRERSERGRLGQRGRIVG